MSLPTRKRLISVFILPILLYGCECWTVTLQMINHLEAAEMWLHRRMLKISGTEHVTNEEVLRIAQTERMLMKTIVKRQQKFVGHIIRKDGLEKLVLSGKIEGKRDRGRQRITYMNVLSSWAKKSTGELFHLADDKQKWKNMVADVLEGYGT